MSPSAIRSPRTVKPSGKAGERKPTSKKAPPEPKKASAAGARSATRTKPVAKAVRAPSPAPKKPETPVKSKPAKIVAPLKKSLVVDVEKPKKKSEKAAPEVKLESAPVKPKAGPEEGERETAPRRPGRPPTKAAKEERVELGEETSKSARGRKPAGESKEKASRDKAVRASKHKPLDTIDEFIADDMPAIEDDEVVDDDAVIPENLEELDPLDLPLALLDPELVEVPRPVVPQRPKPRPRVERQPKQCASCGNTFTWLSVDQLCFNCLKKKLAAKKREDEAYGGFTPEVEDDDSD